MSDFKGYFSWMKKTKAYVQDIEFPFLKIDWKKSDEKNPSFEVDDWMSIVYYMRTGLGRLKEEKSLVFFIGLYFVSGSRFLVHDCVPMSLFIEMDWYQTQEEGRGWIPYSEWESKSSVRDRWTPILRFTTNQTGRRLVICPAGIYFRRIRDLYKKRLVSIPNLMIISSGILEQLIPRKWTSLVNRYL